MAGKSEKLVISPEFYKLMMDRLYREGWDSVRHFTLSNQRELGLSPETTRRIFVECEYKGLEAYTIANVMLCLNFSRSEIKSALKTYTSDKVMWRLIGGEDEDSKLSPVELSLLGMVRDVAVKNPEVVVNVAGVVSSLADAYGVDVSAHMRRIKKGVK